MNYKLMWLSLKKIVSEEAEYILDQMEIIEVREKLLQEKEKDEGKIEDH